MANGSRKKGNKNSTTFNAAAVIGTAKRINAPAVITYEDEYARAERVKDFIEKFCFVPEGKLVGQPFVLLPFELEYIRNVYRTRKGKRIVRRAILSMARKNGKTALIACLLLVHLVGPEAVPNTQMYSTAQSKEQAATVFKLMTKIIRQNPLLVSNTWLRDIPKQADGIGPQTTYAALSSNSATAFGLSPIVAIHDELGQAGAICPIYDAVETGMGAHEEPLSLIISTQAADDTAILSNIIDDAINAPDERTYLQLYTGKEGCDITDTKAWEAANPALDHYRSRDDIQDQADRVLRMPSLEPAFRNLILNQRVNTVRVFITKNVWDMNSAKADIEMVKGKKAYVAIDLSSRIDLTAMMVAVEMDEGKIALFSYCWLPSQGIADRELKDRVPYRAWVEQGFIDLCPGSTIDYRWVVDKIKDVLKDFDVVALAFDRWRIEFLKSMMDAEGLTVPLLPFGQGYKDMAPAVEATEGLALESKLLHGNNPVLRWCLSNTRVLSDPSGNRKLDKARSISRIDPVVAMVMAIGAMSKQTDRPLGEPQLILI